MSKLLFEIGACLKNFDFQTYCDIIKNEMENMLIEEKYIQRFLQDLKQNKLSHGYLLISPDKLFNELVATQMASILLCDENSSCEVCPSCQKLVAGSHPDFAIFPESNSFLVEDAEKVVEKATQSPMISDVKIFLIKNIDDSTVQAQNKILKTLEEPTKSTIFILTATNESKILPTVVSRTRREYLTPLEAEKIKSLIENPPAFFKCLLGEKRNYFESEFADAILFGEGWVGKTLEILKNQSFKEEKSLANQIANEFTSSKQLSIFSAKILALKDNLKGFLSLLEQEFKKLLVEGSNSSMLAIEVAYAINNCALKLERNVSAAIAVDNLLMRILEIKYNYRNN